MGYWGRFFFRENLEMFLEVPVQRRAVPWALGYQICAVSSALGCPCVEGRFWAGGGEAEASASLLLCSLNFM